MTSFIRRRILTSETLGERLKKIREGQGFSLGEAEVGTNIKASYLECLEDGNYSGLPGEVYTRNFLRVYGGFLGLDGQKIVEQYEKERRVDDHKKVAEYAAQGRDLFGNKARSGWAKTFQRLKQISDEKKWRTGLGWKKTFRRDSRSLTGQGKKMSFRSIVLSQIFVKGIVVLLILGVLFYLGSEVVGILSEPSLTVFTPADNLIINQPQIEIKGIVELGASLKINDSEAVYDDKGRFREMINLKEGLNEIKVSAKKEHSREKVVWRRIVVE